MVKRQKRGAKDLNYETQLFLLGTAKSTTKPNNIIFKKILKSILYLLFTYIVIQCVS